MAARDFYVCAVCGYTSETPEEHERCPVCNLAWEKFEDDPLSQLTLAV